MEKCNCEAECRHCTHTEEPIPGRWIRHEPSGEVVVSHHSRDNVFENYQDDGPVLRCRVCGVRGVRGQSPFTTASAQDETCDDCF